MMLGEVLTEMSPRFGIVHRRARRRCWPEGVWLCVQLVNRYSTNAEPYLFIDSATPGWAPAWTPTQADMFSDDWVVEKLNCPFAFKCGCSLGTPDLPAQALDRTSHVVDNSLPEMCTTCGQLHRVSEPHRSVHLGLRDGEPRGIAHKADE